MSKKEIGDKTHKLRRAFIITTIAVGVLAIGAGVFAGLAAKPLIVAMNACLLTGVVCISVGTGVALNKGQNVASEQINKQKAKKALEKIKELDKDKSSKYTQKQRAKIASKYAKANLAITKHRGATFFGEYHTTSGMGKKGTELINKIDAYTILRDTAQTPKNSRKYEKKLKLAESALAKVSEEEGIRTSKSRWTKSYEEAYEGATILDRRTEISCLTPAGRDAFRMVMEHASEPTDNKLVHVSVKYSTDSGIAPSIARAEDQTKAKTIRDILVYDTIEACKNKTQSEIKSMFPIVIEEKIINKNSTKCVGQPTVLKIDSYSELKELGVSQEK